MKISKELLISAVQTLNIIKKLFFNKNINQLNSMLKSKFLKIALYKIKIDEK